MCEKEICIPTGVGNNIKHTKALSYISDKPYMLEQFLKINHPISLCGKPDVVWETRDGTLIVGDYKSRENQR
ncbi:MULTISPECIES: hypothetical protein [Pelosinus]|jgi:hypothetical protein|uniref:PD-(D/E)XK endonuclease-like domain-containing protein n=1 Tax=Pelosinus fermentans B4 TaxID=1149862 RepID=I9AZN9_9FIRM|nr:MULTISPECIES: hypothetical protein [Pelosinus]EIW18332.1 hypothetical protein FB4_3506 [Pelosinus fermentans B4]EIW24318.1 hypothetical protein FA11_3507 [Pelosinus fermentans A11]OAM94236.1 hypothetical protein FR7_02254 [Pelosinus fermentans DSM 17108]SDR03768.1 hypothetical protein SAMN04515679_2351 [Pelosinus fermentans]